MFPNRFPAQSAGDLGGVLRYGFWPETGKMWFQANIEGIGQGASSSADGESAMVHIAEACSRNLPVEIEETNTPTIVERYELITDSGGAGTFRGGLGVRRDYRMLMNGTMLSALERTTSPAEGVLLGQTAHPNHGMLESKTHGNIRFAKIPTQPFENGDLISVRTGGGGGWGDPHLRPPEAVLKDVIDGYVSVASAKDVYHVVIDAATMAINRDSTVILRGQ